MTLTTSTTHVTHGLRSPARESQQRLAASRQHCEQVTRRFAKNFYYGLKLLPEPKRSEMYALYAYMRSLDDIADAEDGRSHRQRVEELDAWRALTHKALDGRLPSNIVGADIWPAFIDLVYRRQVPHELFDAAIAGQHQDLSHPHFHTFDDLHKYCYRVAGVVGVASIYVWGFDGGAETEALAVKRGVAFQLTNILRDLREDAAVGRTYLPREDLAAAAVTEQDLLGGRGGEAFVTLIRAQIVRAERFYEESAALDSRINPDARATLFAMTAIYHALLRKIARDPERVLRERTSLSLLDKLRIASRAARMR